MNSNKRIFLISVMVMVIIAAIAVVPGHHRLVSPVHAGNLPTVAILRCYADPGASFTVYSFDFSGPGPSPSGVLGAGSSCVDDLDVLLQDGFVREDYGEVLALKTTGDRQISTWVFTGSTTAL